MGPFYLNLERRLAEGEGFFFLTLPAPDWSLIPVPDWLPIIPAFLGMGVRPTGFACKFKISRKEQNSRTKIRLVPNFFVFRKILGGLKIYRHTEFKGKKAGRVVYKILEKAKNNQNVFSKILIVL